jgi:hypothetical protein
MSDVSREDFLDWIEKCVANPEVAIRTADRMVEEDSDTANGFFVRASRFLAFGKLALDRIESNAADSSAETLALCEKALMEYSAARNAEDSAYEEEEVHKETVVVKPAGLFSKARTEIRETKLRRTHNNMDWPPFENHLDAVAIILEKARPKSVQQLLGKTKLLYIMAADRLSNSNAVAGMTNRNDAVRADVRSLCGVFVEAPFKIGSAMLAIYMITGQSIHIGCALYEGPRASKPTAY